MKKLLVIMLTLMLIMAFAACGNQEPAEEDLNGEVAEVTPAELIVESETYVPDPTATAENERFITDYQEASDLINGNIFFPEEFDVTRVLIVDDAKVQVEFTCDGVGYMGFYAPGMHENMSGITNGFTVDETVELASINVQLRYAPGEYDEELQQLISPPGDIAVADAYDTTTNISYMLVQQTFTEIDTFRPVIEKFIQSATGFFAPDTNAETEK